MRRRKSPLDENEREGGGGDTQAGRKGKKSFLGESRVCFDKKWSRRRRSRKEEELKGRGGGSKVSKKVEEKEEKKRNGREEACMNY